MMQKKKYPRTVSFFTIIFKNIQRMLSKKVYDAMEMGDWKRVEEVVVAKPSMFFTYLTQKDMEIKHGVRKWFFVPIHLLVLDSPFFQQEMEDTLLIKAVRLGKEDVVNLLLKNTGAAIDMTNKVMDSAESFRFRYLMLVFKGRVKYRLIVVYQRIV